MGVDDITLGGSDDRGSSKGQVGFDAKDLADTIDRGERGVGCATFDPSDISA
jgi:hypothetical protein